MPSGRPISKDTECVLALYERGLSHKEIAYTLSITTAKVTYTLSNHRRREYERIHRTKYKL
jgi:DNA-directed RNA polymerase specialized sigma24 family protein